MPRVEQLWPIIDAVPKRSLPPRRRAPHQVEVRHTPGLADRTMQELAPFLAEEGIDLETSTLDLEELQQALNRAVAKRNHALFTPVGRARELAVVVLRLAVTALVERRPNDAVALLDQAVPESADGSTAEVSSCIGTALRLLDDYLRPDGGTAPPGLRLAPAPSRWPSSSTADDIVSRAAQGRAFDSLHQLSVNHGGRGLHYGCATALAVVFRAWSVQADIPASDLVDSHIR